VALHDGGVTSTSPGRRTGRPPRTSLEQILAAARVVISRDGWERLTMRGLAAEAGVGAPTLYHHVRDKEDLLVHLLDDHVGRSARPELPEHPRDRILAAATAMHEALAAWPWAAEVLTVDGFVGRLNEPALWSVETVVAAALEHGCTPEEAVTVFRSIWYYTVGEILVRAHSRQRPDDAPGYEEEFLRGADAEQLPALTTVGGWWPAYAARDTYADGLRALVDGLLARSGRGGGG